MMAGEHPSEPTLLAYVEDELEADERSEVERHLAACPACAGDVAAVRAGREALRAAAELDLPAGAQTRLDGVLAPPSQPAVARSGRRWLTLVAPVAAALALAGGIATVAVLDPGGGDDESGAMAENAGEEGVAADTGGAATQESAPQEDTSAKDTLLLDRVAADPEQLARELRSLGFRARVEGSTVVVFSSRTAAVRNALRAYASGSVRVVSKAPE